MGAMKAAELAFESYGLDLEKQLELHLTTNHYPPVPVEMVPVCLDAIDAVNSESDWDKEITLPYGITYKGSPTAPAHAIIEQHHLEFWLVESELY
jgi:hypothetical protein